jgi:hypothetical protein
MAKSKWQYQANKDCELSSNEYSYADLSSGTSSQARGWVQMSIINIKKSSQARGRVQMSIINIKESTQARGWVQMSIINIKKWRLVFSSVLSHYLF